MLLPKKAEKKFDFCITQMVLALARCTPNPKSQCTVNSKMQ